MRNRQRCNILAEITQVYVKGDKVGNEGTIESSGQGKYTWIRAGLGSAVWRGRGRQPAEAQGLLPRSSARSSR